MSKKNPEYDFKWCPGCGDFGVKRALEMAMQQWIIQTEQPVENNVIIAGIGCSGNLLHLLDGPQPFGIHGIHGRTLPLALGIKMANPELNVLIVAGDGDFLSIGLEHIAPQAQRNLNVTAVIMDNAVYGLTKGQSSPTTELGEVTSSTPYGKLEGDVRPLELYLSMGVPYVASTFSSNVKEMAQLIQGAMEFDGFSIVHIQSPCTTYKDTFDVLKGNAKKGIEPITWKIPDDHDSSDPDAAFDIVRQPGIPLGLIYQVKDPVPLHRRHQEATAKVKVRGVQEMVDALQI